MRRQAPVRPGTPATGRLQSRQQRWEEQEQKRLQARAIALYNRAILASKSAMARHNELKAYFPPHNRSKRITENINGRHYTEVFEEEMRAFRESKDQFVMCCKLLEKVGHQKSQRTMLIADKHTREIDNYLRQGQELKKTLQAGPTMREEIRLWLNYIRQPRSQALTSRLQLTDTIG